MNASPIIHVVTNDLDSLDLKLSDADGDMMQYKVQRAKADGMVDIVPLSELVKANTGKVVIG